VFCVVGSLMEKKLHKTGYYQFDILVSMFFYNLVLYLGEKLNLP
jgi:hypothetical protein